MEAEIFKTLHEIKSILYAIGLAIFIAVAFKVKWLCMKIMFHKEAGDQYKA